MTLTTSTPYRIRLAAASLLVSAATVGLTPVVAQAAAPGDRAVTITVENWTNERLSLSESDVSEGDWVTRPPKGIKRSSTTQFMTESTESSGGTAGTVTYKTQFGEVEFYWSNPYTRASDYACDVPDELTCEWTSDYNASNQDLVFTLRTA